MKEYALALVFTIILSLAMGLAWVLLTPVGMKIVVSALEIAGPLIDSDPHEEISATLELVSCKGSGSFDEEFALDSMARPETSFISIGDHKASYDE